MTDKHTPTLATQAATPKPLRPFCKDCGWRKGGVDSWDGVSCKCGHSEPAAIDNEIVGRIPRQEDIVRAVNSHDELVAALDAVTQCLAAYLLNEKVGAVRASGLGVLRRARIALDKVSP